MESKFRKRYILMIIVVIMDSILVVDDDEVIREALQKTLKDYPVLTASNGKEAVELYKIHKPAIVLMDINMPEMNGVEATREIKKIDPNASIVVVTSYLKEHFRELRDLGVKDFVEKPFSLKKIREFVYGYLKKLENT